MDKNEIQKLNGITHSLKKINAKIILLALLNRAKIEYEQHRLLDCLKTCKSILSAEPKNPIALRALGCIMQSEGQDKEAIDYYNQALEYSENKEIEYTLIGTVYYNADDYDNAIKYYNMAIDINDNYDLAYEGKNQSMLERHLQILDMQDNLVKRAMFK